MEQAPILILLAAIGLFVLVVAAMLIRSNLLWFWRVNDIVSELEKINVKLGALADSQKIATQRREAVATVAKISGSCHFCGSENAPGVYQGYPICRSCEATGSVALQ